MADNRKKDANRQPREAQSRELSSERKPWAPPSALDAPNPPEGYIHRLVRTEVRGYDDRKNMSARLREAGNLFEQTNILTLNLPHLMKVDMQE